MANYRIRPAEPRDVKAILWLGRASVEGGDAFAWDETAPDEELAFYWLPNEELGHETFVAEDPQGRGLAGACVLQPSAGARSAHVAHGAFAVAPAARGEGLGKRLCSHMVSEARQRGYAGVRFNTVVSTNSAAVRVCLGSGFKIMCTLPRVFNHPRRGLVDAHVMYFDLEGKADCGSTTMVSSVASPIAASASMNSSGFLFPAASPVPNLPQIPAMPAVGEEDGGVQLPRYVRCGGNGSPGDTKVNAGEEVRLEPRLGSGSSFGSTCTFTVEPPLPEGLSLDAASGTVSGSLAPTIPGGLSSHTVTASFSFELPLQVTSAARRQSALSSSMTSGFAINEDFAARLEDARDVHEMPPEPAKHREYGDWMIWIVHRAFINDPSLKELDFTSMHMPPGRVEKRIAPKLMQAVATNTHLEVLSLSNANVQRAEGLLLAESLRTNRTLLELNLESNWLDSSTVRELGLAVAANPACALEHFRVSHQKQMGQFFGRPTEQAIGEMMQANETIVKLGFECDDAHWRNLIDRSLLRNNDHWRRRHQAQMSPTSVHEEELPLEERTLGHLTLQAPPRHLKGDQIFAKDSASHAIYREYVIQARKLPTTSQLQSCAKNTGHPLSYSVAGPLIKECRARLLDLAVSLDVSVQDAFGTTTSGRLKSWKEASDQWTLEVVSEEEGRRYLFRSSKEPGFSVAGSWPDWLGGGVSRRSVSVAGA